MELFFGLLIVGLPAVLLMARGAHPGDRDDSEPTADRPAGPGAEAMAVPAAGEIGPAAEPPPPRERRTDRE